MKVFENSIFAIEHYSSNTSSHVKKPNTTKADKYAEEKLPTLKDDSIHVAEVHNSARLADENYSEVEKVEHESYYNALYLVVVVLAVNMSSSLIMLIPQKNSIEFPKYWYEMMIIFPFTYWLWFLASNLYEFSIILKCPEIISFKFVLDLTLTTFGTQWIGYSLIYVIWTQALGFIHPMPMNGFLSGYFTLIAFLLRLWFKLKKFIKIDAGFRKKRLFLYIYFFWLSAVMMVQFFILTGSFGVIPLNLQWVMGFVIPITKEFNHWMLEKLICKAAGTDDPEAQFIAANLIGFSFALYIIIILGTNAVETTNYSILGVSFGIHIYTILKIIYLHKKMIRNKDNNEMMMKLRIKKDERLDELIQSEAIEIVVPVGYMTTFLLGYYGPNYGILGNIGNSYWQFKKVDDVLTLFEGAFQFLAIDVVGTLISFASFWTFCNINVARSYCKLIKKAWPIMALKLMFLLNQVITMNIRWNIVYNYLYIFPLFTRQWKNKIFLFFSLMVSFLLHLQLILLLSLLGYEMTQEEKHFFKIKP